MDSLNKSQKSFLYSRSPCKKRKTKNKLQKLNSHGFSIAFNAWKYFMDLMRELMKGNKIEKRKAEAKGADLLDWLLAIDASLTCHIQNGDNPEKRYPSSSKRLVHILEEGLYLKPIK